MAVNKINYGKEAQDALYEELLKVKQWVEILLRNAEHQLLTCRFITLKEALESDTANYRATLENINKALSKAEVK